MAMDVLRDIAERVGRGELPSEIALALQLSEDWVKTVIGTDGFQCLLQRVRDGRVSD